MGGMRAFRGGRADGGTQRVDQAQQQQPQSSPFTPSFLSSLTPPPLPPHLVRRRQHGAVGPQQQQVGVAGHALVHKLQRRGGGWVAHARRKPQHQHALIGRGQVHPRQYQAPQLRLELRAKAKELGGGAAVGGRRRQADVGVARVVAEVQPAWHQQGRVSRGRAEGARAANLQLKPAGPGKRGLAARQGSPMSVAVRSRSAAPASCCTTASTFAGTHDCSSVAAATMVV